MSATFEGPFDVTASRTREGHREYKVRSKVRCAATDGPNVIMNCPGLYSIGSTYSISGDSDPWAFCLPTMSVTKAPGYREGEKIRVWITDQTFSTEPQYRCNSTAIEDPLLEPMKLSGTFIKYTKMGMFDKNSNPIVNSGWQLFTGENNQWDANRPTVRIEKNVSSLGLATFSAMIDTVNDSPLWGLPARCVKLSCASWERKLFGVCSYYYTVVYDFDVMFQTFDRYLLDESSRVLKGHWNVSTGQYVLDTIGGSAPNPSNPAHFVNFLDRNGNPGTTLLDGYGRPWDRLGTGTTGTVGQIRVQYYTESNFLTLGIPTSL